jgi:hypothetical protein
VFPLHRDAGRIADLDPEAGEAGSIRAIDPLRHNALGAEPARMGEDSRPIFGNVFIEQDADLGTAQQLR